MKQLNSFEIIVLALTLFIIGTTCAQMMIPMSSEMMKLLNLFEHISCIIFMLEWCIRFKKSDKKLSFTIWNLLDLLASLPLTMIPGLQTVKLIRFVRLLKIAGGTTRLGTYYNKQRSSTIRSLLIIIMLFVVFVAPVIILGVEQNVGNIKSAEDAIWWTYVTVTTIGYGDFYPVTKIGRILTVFLTVGGISMFGIISSLIVTHEIKINEKN